ncbi:MAG TPA: hypothetical protein VF867_19015 [Arthrobacter sp.]
MANFNLDELLTINDRASSSEDLPNAEYHQDHFTGPQLTMFDKNYRGTDLYSTFTVGGWEAGNFHRTVFQGPMVEGPHAYLNTNATVLTAHKQERREAILITVEDTLTIRGAEFAISRSRYGHITLTPVAALADAE